MKLLGECMYVYIDVNTGYPQFTDAMMSVCLDVCNGLYVCVWRYKLVDTCIYVWIDAWSKQMCWGYKQELHQVRAIVTWPCSFSLRSLSCLLATVTFPRHARSHVSISKMPDPRNLWIIYFYNRRNELSGRDIKRIHSSTNFKNLPKFRL